MQETPETPVPVTPTTPTTANIKAGNWPVLITQLQRRENASREMQRLTKRLDSSASDYSKTFQQALKKVPTGYEDLAPSEPSMAAAVDAFLTTTDSIGTLLTTMSKEVDEKVCTALSTLADSMESSRRRLAPIAENAQKQAAEIASSVEKMHQKYCKACRDHDIVANQLQDAEGAEAAAQKKKPKSAELEKKLTKLKTDMIEATEAYKNSITAANSKQDACNERVAQFTAEVLQTLRNREEITRESLAAYVKSVRTAAEAILEAMDKLDTVVQAFDTDKDITEFETRFSVPLPKPFDFEAYVVSEDGDKLRSLSGTGAELGSTPKNNYPKAQFGVPLATALERDETPVPQAIKFLIEQLISLGGPHTKGVFRLVGDKEEIEHFRSVADGTGTLTPLKDPIDASVLIKNWLRALPEPPVPTDLYEKVIDCQGEAIKVFEEIPEPNKTLVGFIIKFLQFMNGEQFINYTMMNAPNLAAMLTPCLVVCPYEDLSKQLICAEKEKSFILELISTLDTSSFPTFDTTENKPIPPLKTDDVERPPAYKNPSSPSISPSTSQSEGLDAVTPVSTTPTTTEPKSPTTETVSPPPPVASPPSRPQFVPRAVPTLSRPSVLASSGRGGGRGSGILRGVLVPAGLVRSQSSQQPLSPKSSSSTQPSQPQSPPQ